MTYKVQQCVGARLRKLSRIADNYYKKRLLQFKITENQITILFILNEVVRIEQGKIGQLLFLERSTISRNIKLLEKRELLSKTTEYRPIVELTDNGKEFVGKISPIWNEIMKELNDKIGDSGFDLINELEVKFD